MNGERPRIRELPGGRLHLSHGPIDVVLRAWGPPPAIDAAYRAAAGRFGEILPELCRELPLLRRAVNRHSTPFANATGSPFPLWGGVRRAGTPDVDCSGILPTLSLRHKGGGDVRTAVPSNLDDHHLPQHPSSPVGRRMYGACRPFADVFVTPMAAVAGAVADELMAVMLGAAELERAYVNDGGDIAVHCAPGAALDVGVAGDFGRGPAPLLNGSLRIEHGDGVGGIATSGAHGRSFSLGIADSVTVLASDAATADVAATLIANAVNIDHPAVERWPARELAPDSDLGDLPVTVTVGELLPEAVLEALEAGRRRAAGYHARGLIADAVLMLAGETASLFADIALISGAAQRHLAKVS
ncbi:MAG TPA: UPF0280 family protein [Hyphomicrobiaceae bacterium]|nr:UPF0280 family protein [Hyphomicrobiaceae bacterium]